MIALCALLIWPAWSYSGSYDIRGTVIDMTPDTSQEAFAKLECAASDEEAVVALQGMLAHGPRSNVVVRLRGDSVKGAVDLQRAGWWDSYEEILEGMLGEWAKPDTGSTSAGGSVVKRRAVTDSQGRFVFVDLPAGVYEISAETPTDPTGMGTEQMRAGRIIVVPAGNHGRRLEIHAHPVAVKGCIADTDGQPVVGAKVTGVPVPFVESQTPPIHYDHAYRHRISTVSRTDGSYELRGFVPPNLYRIAGYLCGRDPTEGGQNSNRFFVEIHIKADGFVQDEDDVRRVPLVSEELLVPARRLLNVMAKKSTHLSKQGKQESQEREIPASHGNTITGIDIVLNATAVESLPAVAILAGPHSSMPIAGAAARDSGLIAAIWGDGRVVWSRDQQRGGPPYFSARIEPPQVQALLDRFDGERVFDARSFRHSWLGPGSSFITIWLQSGTKHTQLQSWHEGFETQPDLVALSTGITSLKGRSRGEALRSDTEEYQRFRQVWAELRATVAALVPKNGDAYTGPTNLELPR